MQCLFCSKLLFNPVQINGEFFKITDYDKPVNIGSQGTEV